MRPLGARFWNSSGLCTAPLAPEVLPSPPVLQSLGSPAENVISLGDALARGCRRTQT